MRYIIREPTENDILNTITVLYSAFGRDIPKNINEDVKLWKSLKELQIGKFLIAEESGKIIGVGGVFIFEKVSSFGYMAVLPKFRGNGIGTFIFRNLLEFAKKKNCESMMLYASKLGEPIYKKFGFKKRFYGTNYKLPAEIPELDILDKEVEILEITPDWLLRLDKKAIGFDRSQYFNLRIGLGAKILSIEEEGYGMLANKRLGPLIAKNHQTAFQIINKGIELGADHIIIAKHHLIPNEIYQLYNLTEQEGGTSIKMVYGKKINEKLEFLYALGTFAKG
ncbi:MAG: GNAT family N-acetyltransferase [Promethearchaeota archaeon]